jgi:hypothetical protein
MAAKKKFVWSEPWFFCQRVRDRQIWIKALIPAVAATVGVAVLLFFFAKIRLPWWEIILLSVGLGLMIQLFIEAAFLRREVTITETDFEVFGQAGQATSFESHQLLLINHLEIRRAEEINKPFAMVVLRTLTGGTIAGVPKSISLERLADTLHRLNVPVILSGWEPSEEVGVSNERKFLAAEDARLIPATVESIPEAERNLNPVPDMVLALIMGVGPFLLWFGLIVWEGVYLFQNRNVLSIWGIIVAAIAGFFSLVIPITYYEMFGEYIAGGYLVRKGRERAGKRAANLIQSFDDKTIAVETIQRDMFDAMAVKVSDFGFIQVDRNRRRVLYEGNKERWTIPAESIRRCAVEEVQYGAAGQSATGKLRCYVVLEFLKDDAPFEIGLRVADVDFGKATDARRLQKATDLFEEITAILPQPTPAAA